MYTQRRTKPIFKIIASAVIFTFLWQQIIWADDLAIATLDNLNQAQFQALAPDYMQNQEVVHQSIISQKQAIEDSMQTASFTAAPLAPTEELYPELMGPRSVSSGQAAPSQPSTILEGGVSMPEPCGAILSLTTQGGDVVHYSSGAISSIEKRDGTLLRGIVLDENNNLIIAEITYTDGTVQMTANGKVAQITRPDGTVFNYNDEELITCQHGQYRLHPGPRVITINVK